MWTLSQDITGLLLAFKIKIFRNSLIYLLTYEYRETFRHGITAVKTAYCCGLRTWIFDQTAGTDADQSLTIHTLLLTF